MRQMIAALVTEGSACVEENAVQRPADIDALAVHGLGFPRRKGGPIRAAHMMGLIGLRKDIRIWAVPALLDEAIKEAKAFDALG
ncbi:hypothetical protein N9499_10505 [Octadecabacter sp.]|nr:hypothetical protein [Octadecabacter sp.]